MIVVATADFELYHEMVTSLRERRLQFTTQEPGDPLPEEADVVVTGADDAPDIPPETGVVIADPGEPRRAIETALAELRGGEGRTIVGIDPGERPGIVVLVGDTVVGTFQVPAEQVGEVVREELAEAPDPLVRIGDGARLVGARIVDDLPDVAVELVDETGTTPYLGTGTRGMGDVLAAANIARRTGEPIEERPIDPTPGEIQRIKDRSREVSDANRAIDGDLARRVASGDLTLRDALAEHESD